jgi:hypothetical protein
MNSGKGDFQAFSLQGVNYTEPVEVERPLIQSGNVSGLIMFQKN